jgi:magnesium chelatase family protein
VLESLREPLEPAFALWSYGVAREKFVSISRAKGTEVFPANFILVAAMNPCPCGFKGTKKECVCSAGDIYKYERKLSGPIMDRVNIFLRHAVAFGGGWLPVAEIWGLEINKVPSSVSDFCKIWFF